MYRAALLSGSPRPLTSPEPVDGQGQDDTSSSGMAMYLLERSPEYRELSAIRKMGWDSAAGDEYFRQQRQKADTADKRMAHIFYHMMQNIGFELQETTGAFTLPAGFAPGEDGRHPPKILDVCMAPGGFLAAVLDLNPRARARAFSLPTAQGGHAVLLPRDRRVKFKQVDVTMLAGDLGMDVADVPPDHPEAPAFLPRQLEPDAAFDLALCDGQVLRTHTRHPDRQHWREPLRLHAAQMALALRHLRPGGTMVVLLHKLDMQRTASLLRTFSRFARVRVHKPMRAHAKRSSFYMVATDVRSRDPEALLAAERWVAAWGAATFGSDDDYNRAARAVDGELNELLEEFGPDIVRLGKTVWETQTKALARASFIKKE